MLGILERLCKILAIIGIVIYCLFMFVLTGFIGSIYAIIGWEIDLVLYILTGKPQLYKGWRYMVHNYVDCYN